jgi:hypothetical protein
VVFAFLDLQMIVKTILFASLEAQIIVKTTWFASFVATCILHQTLTIIETKRHSVFSCFPYYICLFLVSLPHERSFGHAGDEAKWNSLHK